MQNKEGGTDFVVVNDTGNVLRFTAEIGLCDACGKKTDIRKIPVVAEENGVFRAELGAIEAKKDRYLYAAASIGGEERFTAYSPTFWSSFPFGSDYSVKTAQVSEEKVSVSITAESFVKGLFIFAENNETVEYSDNYIDIPAGGSVTVEACRKGGLKAEELRFTDFAREDE